MPAPVSDFGDFQGLLWSGFGPLTEACFLLLQVNDAAEAEEFARKDPSIVGGMNTFTLTPMRVAASQSSKATAS